MPDLKNIVAALERYYGPAPLPATRGPFELVLWENAVYLLPDERRAEVFETLRQRAGLTPETLWKTPDEVLLPIAARGGMRPETRVFRWREIARITIEEFQGNLDQILNWDYAQAKKALQRFPSIGEPGAEKILMYCGMAQGLPLESNGLRVLVRLGYGRPHVKNYSALYKSAQEAIADQLPKGASKIARAHLVLRTHGKTLCKDASPRCFECPVAPQCGFPAK